MEIISHRGYWKELDEKNQRVAFERSFQLGFGTETDLRDQGGRVVISHDPPTGPVLTLDEVLEMHGSLAPHTTLALNVKADGLQGWVKEALERHGTQRAFVFDMSVPDSLGYIAAGVPIYARQSEYEPEPAFVRESAGVWLDAFQGEWYSRDIIEAQIALGKSVCFVSPELHKREPTALWSKLRSWKLHLEARCLLCTDMPEDARRYFDEQD